MYEVVLKQFENPDEVRSFEKGKFEVIHVGGMTIGRATYEPGWKWSLHVGRMWELRVAWLSMSGWLCRGERRLRWRMAA
jgi:hypothetical protein